MMDLVKLEKHLEELEIELLSENIRKNPQKLAALIADDFLEIGASGNIWSRQTVIEALKNENYRETSVSDFQLTLLSERTALVTYHARRKQTIEFPETDSLRSSIWQQFDDDWKIIFHQGTPVHS